MSNQKIYVPLIIDTGGPTEIVACGAFARKCDAVNTLLDELINRDLISFKDYQNNFAQDKLWLESLALDEETLQNYYRGVITERGRFLRRMDEECVDEKSFRIYLAQKVDGNFRELDSICEDFGNGQYGDEWTIRIDGFELK